MGFLGTPAQAGDGVLYVAEDHTEGYDRALFKLWVDADKNGCDTRAEVLIKEAIVKPKKGANCKLTGGKWVSSYDGITYTNSSKLDIDHLVPLAEAWRSGAWAWTDKEREEYANYLENERALNAVTASVNRSKGDKDIANWLPKKNVCDYLAGWVTVKANFQLTVDAAEAKIISKYYSSCGLGWITKPATAAQSNQTLREISAIPVTSLVAQTRPDPVNYSDVFLDRFVGYSQSSDYYLVIEPLVYNESCSSGDIYLRQAYAPENSQLGALIPNLGKYRNGLIIKIPTFPISLKCPLQQSKSYKFYLLETPQMSFNLIGKSKVIQLEVPTTFTPTPTPTPTPNSELVITPGAFCAPAGAIGKDSSGVIYTCKTSPTDTRNRWRQ